MATAPKKITYHRADAELELTWPGDEVYRLSAEFLRVHSPSAEVRGHGIGQEVLQTGKRLVTISGLEPVGRYALRITFDDGHDSGLFNWDYLSELCENKERFWQSYLDKLEAAGESRDARFIQAKQL